MRKKPVRRSPHSASHWLSFYVPCNSNSWQKALREVRRSSHHAIDIGLATQWFYVLYDEGKGMRLRWRIRVRNGKQRELALGVHPKSLVREQVAYAPELRRYGGRKALSVCESIFGLSSEAASEILGARRWDYNSRIVLAVILQRQLLGGLSKGLSLSRNSVLTSFRDSWIRHGSRGDSERAGELTRKIRTIARTAFHMGKLRAFEVTLAGRLRPFSRRYAEAARILRRIGRNDSIQLPPGTRRGPSWSESIARSLMHMLNNRLFIRNIDEALVAEVVLRRFGHGSRKPFETS